MVGRMSKRNKRARMESETRQQSQAQPQEQSQEEQQQQEQQQAPRVEANVASTQSLETPVSDFAVSPEDSLPAWSNELLSDPTMGGMLPIDGLGDLYLEGQTNAPSSESSLALTNKASPTPDFSFDLLSADLSINQFIMPNMVDQNAISSAGLCFSDPTSTNSHLSCPQVPARTTPPKAFQHEPFADLYDQNRQYPHVLALTRIVELLEAYIQLQTTAIDELMRVNKACMIDITRIMELKEYDMCKSCGILASTAMELVVTLYEKGVSSDTITTHKQQSQESALCTNELPNLQFGVFDVDPEEQIAFRNRIICKELQRSIEIIKRFSEQSQNSASEGSQSGKVHKQWYVEMEHRAKRLVSSLGGWFD